MIEEKTLFEKIGGMKTVNDAVYIFYAKVLMDDTIRHFFNLILMNDQACKLKVFLAYAFGNKTSFNSTNLRAVHSYLDITEAHFYAVIGHLNTTLKELNVEQNLIDEVNLIVLATKQDLLEI
jgi:hemoglobin